MSERKEWLNGLGQILESKKGKLYIKVDKDVSLSAGDIINMEDHMDSLTRSFKNNKIDKDTYDRLVNNTGFVKYKLHLPPSA